MENLKTITLRLPDVSCQHCVATVNGVLQRQPTVQTVRVDLEEKTVSFSYDPDQVTLQGIEHVLADAGYPVAE